MHREVKVQIAKWHLGRMFSKATVKSRLQIVSYLDPAHLRVTPSLAESLWQNGPSYYPIFTFVLIYMLPQLEVYEKAQCEAMNMGLYLGVSECSDEPPKFIHLKYTPKGEA